MLPRRLAVTLYVSLSAGLVSAAARAESLLEALAPAAGTRPARVLPRLPEDRFPNALRNPRFDPGLAGWSFSYEETGGRGRALAAKGRAVVAVEGARRNGTAFLSQQVDLRPGWSYDFRVQARDHGAVEGYSYILREIQADGTWRDTQLDAPATRGGWTEHAVRWDPRTPSPRWLLVHLRIAIRAGSSGTATFVRPSLRPSGRYDWTVDGKGMPDGPLSLETGGLPDGERSIELVARRRADGAAVSGRLSLTLAGAPVIAAIDVPAIVHSRDVVASGAGSRDPEAADLLPPWDAGSARQAWRLLDDEAGGRSSVSFEPAADGGVEAVVRVEQAERRGAVYLLHEFPAAGLAGPFQLGLRRRDDGRLWSYGFVIRELGSYGPPGYVDTIGEFDAASEWEWAALDWSPAQGTRRVQVLLRFLVAPGATTEVRLRDVSLRPRLTYRWEPLGGVTERRNAHTVAFRGLAPGVHRVGLAVSRSPDAPPAHAERRIAVVEEPPVACLAPTGGTRLLWRPGTDLEAMRFEVRGSDDALLGPLPGPKQAWELDLPAGASPERLRLVAVGAPGSGLPVRYSLPASGPLAHLVAAPERPSVGVGQLCTIRVRTCGEPIDSVPLQDGARIRLVPARGIGGGWFVAEFRPSLADVFRTYRPWGTGEPLRVGPSLGVVFEGFAGGLGLLALILTLRRRRG